MNKLGIYVSIKNDSNDLKYILSYCKTNKIRDYELFIDKVNSRNDVSNRKQLEKLKIKVINKKIDTILVKNIEQISRNFSYNSDFIEFLNNNNCKLINIHGQNLCLFYSYLNNAKKEILNKKNKEEIER